VALQTRMPAPAFTPSCASVLRLTPASFSVVYTAQVHDMSDLALDQAAGYWARCLQQATAAAMAGNPSLAARISRLRTVLTAVRETEAQLALLRAGGGTLYTHVLNRSVTDREQLLADIAALSGTTLDAPSSTYGALISSALGSIQARLQRVQHPSKADLQFTTQKAWNAAARAYVRAVRAAEAAAGTRNDAIRTLILTFIDQPLFLDTPVGSPG
ncbi:MAG TPA: hypothetical protein VHB98_17825, partial [Chloroflexota bacterium]|nr:hypothetical protein [Chloroflexota bacterium]